MQTNLSAQEFAGKLLGTYPEATLTRKVSHPQASELCWRRWVGENPQLLE
jgi:hypothetical protein